MMSPCLHALLPWYKTKHECLVIDGLATLGTRRNPSANEHGERPNAVHTNAVVLFCRQLGQFPPKADTYISQYHRWILHRGGSRFSGAGGQVVGNRSSFGSSFIIFFFSHRRYLRLDTIGEMQVLDSMIPAQMIRTRCDTHLRRCVLNTSHY